MKNIIDTDCLIGAEHIIFANREFSAFAEMELLAEKSAFAEDYGGLIRIAFEK